MRALAPSEIEVMGERNPTDGRHIQQRLAVGAPAHCEGDAFHATYELVEEFRCELRKLNADWRRRARENHLLHPHAARHVIFIAALEFMELDLSTADDWGTSRAE